MKHAVPVIAVVCFLVLKSSEALTYSSRTINHVGILAKPECPRASKFAVGNRLTGFTPLRMTLSTPEPSTKAMDEVNETIVAAVKGFITIFFPVERPFARFYALETIARVPYFSYLSVLHLYETLGRWRRADLLKMHFAESWNEMHHLLIMEELGGNEIFLDRFIAQHIAFFYYFLVVGCYIFWPELAYNLNKKVEEHAYKTYDEFINANEEMLKSQPVTPTAKAYYTNDELFLTHKSDAMRGESLAKLDTLYDVFVNIRADEAEHAVAMGGLEDEAMKTGEAFGATPTYSVNPMDALPPISSSDKQ